MSINPTAEITVRPAQLREEPVFGVRTPGDSDRGTSDDVARAANPLHYIPFVSQVYEAATGETGSAAMKIIGGAALGGPIGFLVGVASAIFEQETGKTVVAAVADAFAGEDTAPTQVASARADAEPTVAALAAPVPEVEILPPAATAARMSPVAATPLGQQDRDVLALFGQQQRSAHDSYRKAQMMSYLKDVGSSMVL